MENVKEKKDKEREIRKVNKKNEITRRRRKTFDSKFVILLIVWET